MQGTPPTSQGLPTPQAFLLRPDTIGQLMFSGKQQFVLTKKQNVLIYILSYRVHRVPQLRGNSGVGVRFIPRVQFICALTLNTSRREVGAVKDWWNCTTIKHSILVSSVSELIIVISLHSRVGLSCQMETSPASGFWHVCKCPGSIYRKTEFWFTSTVWSRKVRCLPVFASFVRFSCLLQVSVTRFLR